MKTLYRFLILGAFIATTMNSCTDSVLNEIGSNPNSPTEVPIKLLMPQVGVDLAFGVLGVDLAWYSSVFVEHTTGVHGQLEGADKRTEINSTMVNNSWNTIYADFLSDLEAIIERGSAGGAEEGAFTSVGIAKVLKAFGFSVATDLWGEVPFSEALKGSENRTPAFDSQETVYNGLFALLDSAIADLAMSSVSPGSSDFYYGGNPELWTKAAYALKARLYNRLSKKDPQGSANNALAAIANSFSSPEESMIFSSFTTAATGQNPWFQELNDRSHHAVSVTMNSILEGLSDPRRELWFGDIDGEIVPAPNGTAVTDQAGSIYSRASESYLTATSPIPIITYDELKFIEAEANLRLGERDLAYAAYQEAVVAALERANVAGEDIDAYTSQAQVFTGAANLTLADIIRQKYVSFWLFQPIEAYNDYRRTGFPTLSNPISPPPQRFPYTQDEIASNTANVPNVSFQTKVWWAE